MTRPLLPLAIALALTGCVAAPVVAFPGSGKTFDAFQQDDATCRQQSVQAPASAATADGVAPRTPALAYAQCMVAHGNRLGPPSRPPEPYLAAGAGVYSGFGDTFPWSYGGRLGY